MYKKLSARLRQKNRRKHAWISALRKAGEKARSFN